MPLAAWPVSSAFSDSFMRGAVPWPSRSSGTKAAPSLRRCGDREVAGGDAVDDDGAGVLRQALAGERGEQLVLAVAGDAGDAEDFAALQLERDVLEPHAVRIVGLEGKVVDDEPRHGGLAACAAAFTSLISPPTIMRASEAAVSRRGIAGRDLLAAAQDGGGVAQPLHLFELVADVEDGAAFGLEAFQHDEELVGLLRRQHRGRLVQDQEFRILHQRADDLDALALADRQLPDLAPGIERQAVGLRDLLQPRRHVLEGFPAVEAERDVLGDGEIVEQREMLEHHADAAARASDGPGQHDLSRPASASRRRSAGSGRRWS